MPAQPTLHEAADDGHDNEDAKEPCKRGRVIGIHAVNHLLPQFEKSVQLEPLFLKATNIGSRRH